MQKGCSREGAGNKASLRVEAGGEGGGRTGWQFWGGGTEWGRSGDRKGCWGLQLGEDRQDREGE